MRPSVNGVVLLIGDLSGRKLWVDPSARAHRLHAGRAPVAIRRSLRRCPCPRRSVRLPGRKIPSGCPRSSHPDRGPKSRRRPVCLQEQCAYLCRFHDFRNFRQSGCALGSDRLRQFLIAQKIVRWHTAAECSCLHRGKRPNAVRDLDEAAAPRE